MGRRVAPEKFVAGETVEFFQDENRFPVEIVSVNGDEVVANVQGEMIVFIPRPDGKHVAVGTSESSVMPVMIFHTNPKRFANPVPARAEHSRGHSRGNIHG